jgi:hypothetical protein
MLFSRNQHTKAENEYRFPPTLPASANIGALTSFTGEVTASNPIIKTCCEVRQV